jgi:alkanesulfonate monooxygenase SsuD/methylene tetrahydromethanopterin reductase-like flavin-dependent oxidoreductase (luciferase family)
MNEVRRRISLLKEHCDTIGRNHKEIELSVVLRCLIKETVEDIERQITVWKNKNENIEQFKNRLGTETLIGTPEQIVSKLREYIDMGIDHFVFHFIGLKRETIELFNSKVISRI